MNRLLIFAFPLVLFWCAINPRLAAGDSLPLTTAMPSHGNAALQYWVAFSFSPMRDSKSPRWLDLMAKNPNAPASSEAEQSDSIPLKYLHAGAKLPGGSFESLVSIREFGPDGTILPHINQVRRLANLALARACWRFQNQQAWLAITDCLAALSLGSDLSNNGCATEVLWGAAIQNQAYTVLGIYLPSCTEDERGKLANLIEVPRYALHLNGLASNGASNDVLTREKFLSDISDGKDMSAGKNLADTFPGLSGNDLDSLKQVVSDINPEIITTSCSVTFLWKHGPVTFIQVADKTGSSRVISSVIALSHGTISEEEILSCLLVAEVRRKLLLYAAQQIGQPSGIQDVNRALAGLKIKGRVESLVTLDGPVTILSIKEPAHGNPIQLIIGRYKLQEKISEDAPKPTDANDF